MPVKRLLVSIAVLFGLLITNLSQAQQGQPKAVSIPDANLAAAIRQEIGNSITTHTLLNLTQLEAPGRGIKNLTGLQHARNLKVLSLYTNEISDISALAGLTQLTELVLRSNSITDLAPLAGLTQLTGLELEGNNISDVSPLSTLKQLTGLGLVWNNISDISPLAALTQLTGLGLGGNNISDISALAKLTQLTSLDLGANSISDISTLAELKRLKKLKLGSNNISDISPLAALKQLTELGLFSNNITDLSLLAALKQLNWLDLPLNTISDVSPLAGLEQLTWLRLSNNKISDVSPIVGLNLTGTKGNSIGLDIERNPLSYVSINTHIPAMQAKGIEVKFDTRVPTTLVKVSGIAQHGGINSTVPFPFVVEVRDEQNQAFAGVPVWFTITDGGGKLSATTVTTDTTGKAATQLRMGPTLGTTTVRVTAAHILKPVQFTVTALPRSTPVTVPDDNLRARITETLRKPPDATLTAADMLKLRALIANDAGIHDLTGLQHASNLTILSLNNNSISDVSPLVGLTQLTTLALRDNWISNVSPLVDLAQLRGSTSLQELYLQGNSLSDTAISTHIPWLQGTGVDVRFDNDLTRSEYVVRLIYFRPRDRQPPLNINAKMDQLIKDVQQFYADQMEAHGFGRKTFQFETDAHGNAVVYHIVGRFEDTDYADHDNNPFSEIGEQLRASKRIRLVVLDRNFYSRKICGSGSGGSHDGLATIYGLDCLGFSTVAHELGHAFGLHHDFRSNAYMMSYGTARRELSQCAAKWLDVHRYFNTHQAAANAKTIIEMLPPSLASPPNAIRFRFKVTDPDGLHQAQLLTTTLSGAAKGSLELIACKHLNGKPSDTVNFVTTSLGPENRSVSLDVMDVNGNFPNSRTLFPVDVTSLLPPPEVVSIPDPNLAAAIRQEIGDSITTLTLLNLTRLIASYSGIKNLTGLQHARNLKELHLGGNAISDFSPIAGLTQLTELRLSSGNISDVSFLSGLTQLTLLVLPRFNNISDRSPLAELKRLAWLDLGGSNISDISSLAELKRLTWLNLQFSNISDVSALAGLKNLKYLNLSYNAISDFSPLNRLPEETLIRVEHNPGVFAGGAPRIEGPWLWVIGSTGEIGGAEAANSGIDFLHQMSDGIVTELKIATKGATEGNPVGDARWTLHKLSPTGSNNINDMVNAAGLGIGDIDHHVAYGSITLDSPRRQRTRMYIGSDDAVKVWLNGTLVHNNPVNRGAGAFHERFPVTLETGTNILLVAVYENRGKWSGFFGFASDAEYTVPVTTGTADRPVWDVNGDGVVNVQDLVLVSSRLGETGENMADVNGDGVVNIQDLVLVAGELGGAAAAPSVSPGTSAALSSRATVKQWLAAAYRLPRLDVRLQRGIDWLERLLAALPPEETTLLANYPNPFNPETWIPYQLATPAEVTLRIYAVNGTLVRALTLGHQRAGVYRTRGRAAYWDGRNAQGECVASGVYFYTLVAGDFTATRKMLVLK